MKKLLLAAMAGIVFLCIPTTSNAEVLEHPVSECEPIMAFMVDTVENILYKGESVSVTLAKANKLELSANGIIRAKIVALISHQNFADMYPDSLKLSFVEREIFRIELETSAFRLASACIETKGRFRIPNDDRKTNI